VEIIISSDIKSLNKIEQIIKGKHTVKTKIKIDYDEDTLTLII